MHSHTMLPNLCKKILTCICSDDAIMHVNIKHNMNQHNKFMCGQCDQKYPDTLFVKYRCEQLVDSTFHRSWFEW